MEVLLAIFFLAHAFGVLVHANAAEENIEPDIGSTVAYLRKYGYLSESPFTYAGPTEVSSAINDLQSFAGLPPTGKIDIATMKLMKRPRCGVKDHVTHGGRFRRYERQGTKWHKNRLTWMLVSDTSSGLSRKEVEDLLEKSFQMWTHVTKIYFDKLQYPRVSNIADIEVSFSSGNHGDKYPFDGVGGTLAHAYFPLTNKDISGDIHVDDDEKWTIGSYQGTNLFWVLVHEIGHSLGLDHSDVESAVMYPWYTDYRPGFRLKQDDISGIQSIYGVPVFLRYQVSVPVPGSQYAQKVRDGGCPEHHKLIISRPKVRSVEDCAKRCLADSACANFATGKYHADTKCYLYRAGCTPGTDVMWYDTWRNAPVWKPDGRSPNTYLKTLDDTVLSATTTLEKKTCFRFTKISTADEDIDFKVGNRGCQSSFVHSSGRYKDATALIAGCQSEDEILKGIANVIERRSAVPPGAPGCQEQNIDYSGNDYALSLPVKSWQECGRLCTMSKRCNFWSWKPTGTCYYKKNPNGRTGEIGTVSGEKYCQGIGLKTICSYEDGYCLDDNGVDQNSGVVRLPDITYDAVRISGSSYEELCIFQCQTYPGATGCEFWPRINGCNAHTMPVSRGSGGSNKHRCSVFKKCTSCVRDGFDYDGSLVTPGGKCTTKYADWRGCAAHCGRTNGCNVWVWNTKKYGWKPTHCCLKSNNGKFVRSSNVISGQAGCMDGGYVKKTLNDQDYDRITKTCA